MKLYIWHHADYVTDNYHPEAGVVVLAHSVEQARAIFQERQLKDYVVNPPAPEVLTKEPDEVHDLSTTKAWIFPDAGCC